MDKDSSDVLKAIKAYLERAKDWPAPECFLAIYDCVYDKDIGSWIFHLDFSVDGKIVSRRLDAALLEEKENERI